MENLSLLDQQGIQVNNSENTKGLPHFIVIQKLNNKKVRIPCVNEKVAEKVLNRFNKLKSSDQ